jgi:hypothetical protein
MDAVVLVHDPREIGDQQLAAGRDVLVEVVGRGKAALGDAVDPELIVSGDYTRQRSTPC